MARAADALAERDALAADLAAQERGPAVLLSTPRTVPQWVRVTHPEHGEPVTFVPGEALPAWVVELLPTGQRDPADDRVLVIP